jgi:molybdate transport system regulatory protein
MKLAYKVWLDNEGKAFGDGPYELLTLVAQTGSLHRAAKQMGMSYRKAWLLIQAMEKRLGFEILESQVGGISGGGSKITPQAQAFMQHYDRFRNEAGLVLTAVYNKYFGA